MRLDWCDRRDWSLDVQKMLAPILGSHKEWLKNIQPSLRRMFDERLSNDPDAGCFEAVVRDLLECFGFEATPRETGKGGYDFAARHKVTGDEIAVEAACIKRKAIEERSGLPDDYASEGGGSFTLISDVVRRVASGKVPQLSGGGTEPRVLFLGTFHTWGHMLLGRTGAEWAVCKPRILIRRDGQGGHIEANLDESLFFKWEKDQVVPARRSISAVILVSFLHQEHLKARLYGILHPEPNVPLGISLFRNVPFLRVVPWPLSPGGSFHTEWLVSSPEGACIPII